MLRGWASFVAALFVGVIFCGEAAHVAGQGGGAPIDSEPLFALPPVEEPPGLTLAEAEQAALAQNPALAKAAAALASAQAKWVQAGLYPDPSVQIGEAQLASQGKAEQDFVGVTQTIVTGGKLKLSQEVAAAKVAQAEREAAAQQGRVLTDVRTAFFDVLVAQAEVDAARELAKIAEDSVELANMSVAKNKTAKNDQIEAGIEVNTAHLWLRGSENRLRAARTALAAALGLPRELCERVVGQIDALPPERTWEQSLQRLMCLSPELASTAAQNDQARWALARARAERVPDVSVQGLVNWRDNGIGGNADGFVQASLPLRVWNANRGNIASAEADVAATARGVEVRRLELQQRLAEAFERYKNARQQALVYRDEILPAAKKALAMTNEGFASGDVEYNDVLTSQRTNANARKNYLDALQDFWRAEFEIEGLLLSDSLKQ